MAGGPYSDRNGSKYIVWSDKKLHPDQPKLREQLKTKKTPEANKRKHRLEELYNIGKHQPWQKKWYENPSIKPFVTDSLLNGDIRDIHSTRSITLYNASESYINYQLNRPAGWQSETTQNLYPKIIRFFVDKIGHDKPLKMIESEDIHKVLHRPGQSDETIRSNRSKLKALFNYCVEQGWLVKAPKIETATPVKKVPKFFYDLQFLKCCWYKIHQVQHTLHNMGTTTEAKNQLRYVLAWQLMAGTGMRPDEAINVRVQDVYGDQILVGAWSRTKTSTQRMVPILYEAQSAASVLTDLNYRKLDKALSRSDRLLGIESQRSKERASTELREAFKATGGTGRRTAYNLRDYFAVRFLADSEGSQDFRLLQLRNILGHTSITTTEKYLKAVPARLDLSIPNTANLVKELSAISTGVTE